MSVDYKGKNENKIHFPTLTDFGNSGEDINRQGLLKTPERAAKAMMAFTKGYDDQLDGQL